MSQDGWQTVEKNPKKRGGASNTNAKPAPSSGFTTVQKKSQSGAKKPASGSNASGTSFSQIASQSASKPKNVVAKPVQKEKKVEVIPTASVANPTSTTEVKKESKTRKSFEEFGWKDLKQLRRIVAHLEAIANYSKGGIIGSLRLKTIHNSEDREQDVTPFTEIKINSQEDAFMRYVAEFVDVAEKRDENMDVLLGFMSILLTCIAHIRYYNRDQQIDNYWTYHQEFTYNVWKLDSIPTSLHEAVYRELQEKLQSKPLAIDHANLQRLLNGKGFDFRYDGNLSVPFCLNALKEHINCNQSKAVNQRRRLYRYEHKSGAGSRAGNTERAEWTAIAGVSKDYKVQVEEFEKLYMSGDAAPVLGLSSIDTLLHSIYTSFLKIRKRETPQDLLNRLKSLLIAIPNLIDLPELLQSLNESGKWCGYDSIESHPDLADYAEIKKGLEALLEKSGVKKRSNNVDNIRDTLNAIYEFNIVEEKKTTEYKKFLGSSEASNPDATVPPKGYPLSPKLLKELILQLELSEEDLKTYDEELRKVSKLSGMNSLLSSLKRIHAPETKVEEETVDVLDTFDEFDQMDAEE